MNDHTSSIPLSRRILRYAAVENLVYWATGAIAWIPWYFSDKLGMLAMLVLVPITIFFGTLYCLKRIPHDHWKKEIRVINATFVITCVLIDLFFWVVWRGNNIIEWYLPTTLLGTVNFIGYFEMIIVCYITYLLASSSKKVKGIQERIKFGDRFVVITGIVLFSFSLISALLFW